MKKTHYEELSSHMPLSKLPVLIGADPLGRVLSLEGAKSVTHLHDYLTPSFAYGVLAEFFQQGAEVYRFAKEFGEALSNTPLAEVQSLHLYPTNKFVCIEFPDSIHFRLAHTPQIVKCAYVAVSSGLSVKNKLGQPVNKALHIFTPAYDSVSGRLMPSHVYAHVVEFTHEEESLSDASNRAKIVSDGYMPDGEAMLKYVINCLLYLQSGTPDLRQYRAPKPPLTKKVKVLKLWSRRHENLSLMDMTLVGFNYLKPINYSVTDTTVRGHFRWQPHGEGRSKIKLIWVDSHTRHYNNEDHL